MPREKNTFISRIFYNKLASGADEVRRGTRDVFFGRRRRTTSSNSSNFGGNVRKTKRKPTKNKKQSHRRVVVFASLVGVLTITSAILLALAPAPLTPDAYSSLFAIDAPKSMDVIFDTKVPCTPTRWKYIYIHQSRTTSGNANTLSQSPGGLGDHFVIGNGDGCIDGEIQIGQRWNQQLSATAPSPSTTIDPACISICLVGDFDRTVPTSTQLRRVAQLAGALQGQLHIASSSVLVFDQSNTPAGIGRYFPTTAFRSQLLP